ncbi:hypothetical protein Zmor_005731 [Zophobas morio]|uniref:Uncharacterized protein n=1 Tax=Zophobas morio TaxID=2755281 RepID=A0AA38IVV8_9CUCU|nr:hypothetical protein Zmor_005730 [Zophobas morio]KAJ3661332.1 hypothetical protein Zmor_005731 [Zophobas morio]
MLRNKPIRRLGTTPMGFLEGVLVCTAMIGHSSLVTTAGCRSLKKTWKRESRWILQQILVAEYLEATFGNDSFSQRESPVKLRRNYSVHNLCIVSQFCITVE